MKKVVSFSGGRTSAYLCFLAVEQFGRENVDFIFCDTGAEHPATYEFIKQCDEYFGLNLVCLRGVYDTELGQRNNVEIGGTEIIGPDLKPFSGCMGKYGTPYIPGGGMCSRAMKGEVFANYCKDKYGRKKFETWLGIRADEPKRFFGEDLWKEILNHGVLNDEASDLFNNFASSDLPDDLIAKIAKRKSKLQASNTHYLAEISNFDRQDVLDWWAKMPFDLSIQEHLGNCVFCIKKSIGKVALAARDEPVMAQEFIHIINLANPRPDLERKMPKEIMYRGENSLVSVIDKYADYSRDDIAGTLKNAKAYESGSCSESCEAISLEFDDIEATESQYAKKLTALKAQPCHKLKEVGDQWRTPDWLYWGVFANFGPFVIDLFSDGDNAKCGRFYTAKDNALVQDWTKDLAGGKGFFNPPYSRSSYEDGQAITGMRNIIDKVMQERDKGAQVVGLIKAATSEVWWPEEADRVVFIRGRIGFELPEWFIPADKKQESTGAGFASAICIFDKSYRGERIGYISREKLRQDGETLMALISQQQATGTGNGVWPKEIAEIVGLFRQADPSVVDEFGDELCALANKMHLAGYKVSATVNNIVGAIASADRTNSYKNGVRYASTDC